MLFCAFLILIFESFPACSLDRLPLRALLISSYLVYLTFDHPNRFLSYNLDLDLEVEACELMIMAAFLSLPQRVRVAE